MNKRNKLFMLLFLLATCICYTAAQEILVHSHNDYRQRVPFYQAYAQQAASIEADIFSTENEGELLVAHDREELPSAPTIDEAYILPLVHLYKQNNGKAWKQSDRLLTLLVDLKTPVEPTLNRLIRKLEAYPDVFDPEVNPYAVRVVISGNRPDPADFGNYPSVISFDGSRTDYTTEQLEKIRMISLNLKNYTRWNGKGSMKADELQQVKEVIRAVHNLKKPVRFWNTPDGVTTWNTLHTLGVDYINTDRPEACAAFFRDFHKKTYRRKTGEKPVGTYLPTYRNDGMDKPVKNVILLIGDGMGLAQICAADAINETLSLLHIKHIGLQKTEAGDTYTTDSAAAGSALATGRKHNNRHISMSPDGEAYPSLTDTFHQNGYACGVVTMGNLADATPAAFYGHSTERDHSDEITSWLLEGKLTLLSGSGMNNFTERNDGKELLPKLTSTANYTIQTTIEDINKTKGKVICIDERMGEAATESSFPLLAEATREAIKKLSEESEKGFFLMVEGAKIDYAGHANSLPGSILETLGFDKAVAEALKFADSNGETLVIVTGDHETGGLSLVDADRESRSVTAHYMTNDHTPLMLPVFAYGPCANAFIGVYQNTEIFHKIQKITKTKQRL